MMRVKIMISVGVLLAAVRLCGNRPPNRSPGPVRLHGSHFRFLEESDAF